MNVNRSISKDSDESENSDCLDMAIDFGNVEEENDDLLIYNEKLLKGKKKEVKL